MPELIGNLLTGLEQSAPVALLRTSFWLYPLVNTAHIIGIALLTGAIIAYDIAVLRQPSADVHVRLQRAFLPVAGFGLALAILAGMFLFSVKAIEYAGNPAFRIKMVLLVIGLANIVMLHRGIIKTRSAATSSIFIWISAIIAGRFIAFV